MSDPRAFLYRTLDPEQAQALATKHLARHDDGELFLQYRLSEAFGFDDGRLKTADYNNASQRSRHFFCIACQLQPLQVKIRVYLFSDH